MTDARPEHQPPITSRIWRTADGMHIDLRGAAESMTELLQTIDSGRVDGVLVGHFDHEPISLYPELEDRGWSHEVLASHCGGTDCEDGLMLRMVRWGR